MYKTIPKCAGCGVPQAECIGKGKSIGYQKSSSYFEHKDDIITDGHYGTISWDWYCSRCVESVSVNCSHCDEPIKGTLSDPLDDGSFLCKKCDTKLNEELEKYEQYC